MKKSSISAITQIQAVIIAVIIIVAAVAGVYYWTLPPPSPPPEAFKVALCVVPSREDTWSVMAWDGLQQIDEDFEDIEAAIFDKVAVADFVRVAGDLVDDGYDLIIAHTYDYFDVVQTAADEYPDTQFAVQGGFMLRDNLAGYEFGNEEPSYLAGMLAALMTETNRVAFIHGFSYPSTNINANGFILGARSINENITVDVRWVGSWYDVAKAYEIALSIIADGGDVLHPALTGAGLGVLDACKEKGVYAIGVVVDQYDYAPEVMLTSVVWTSYTPFLTLINMTRAGTVGGKLHRFTLATGGSELAPYHGLEDVIPQEVKDLIDEERENIINGLTQVPYIPWLID